MGKEINKAPKKIEPTEEQKKIINYNLNLGEALVVEAGAGTGKTTCFIEFSKAHPEEKILYLCFNNKSAQEAKEKYAKVNIKNTKTSTVHGLAYKVKKHYSELGKFQTKIAPKDIQTRFGFDLTTSCLILKTIKNFCESPDRKISTSHTPTLEGIKNASFDPPFGCNLNLQNIEQTTPKNDEDLENKQREDISLKSSKVWKQMVSPKSNMPISYDHYLKIFQLSNPILDYSYILLDEAQDSNPVTLALLESQKSRTRTILIGDKNQAIYGWRGAKNAMGKYDSTATLHLTQSFRFGGNIAHAANHLLKKYHKEEPRIKGLNKPDKVGAIPKNKPKTFIARTNSTLFDKALELIEDDKSYHFLGTTEKENWDPSKIYKLNDLKDVYRLYIKDAKNIENPYIKIYSNYENLKKAAFGVSLNGGNNTKTNDNISLKSGDTELQYLCRIVEKYKHSIPEVVHKLVKNSACPAQKGDPNSHKTITLTTAHRAKGLEWDNVEVAEDFCSLNPLSDEGPTLKEKIPNTEELNLLYVAITRAKKRLSPPKTLLKSLELDTPKRNYKQLDKDKDIIPNDHLL